jgi:hypothetical protein
MNTRITRRRIVTALAGLPILRLGPEIKPSRRRAYGPSGVTTSDGQPVSWKELADELACMERRGVEAENPLTWDQLCYDDLLRWSDGVLLLFGFGTVKQSDEKLDSHCTWLDESGIEVYAAGCSEDYRAWTMFVRARLIGDWDGRMPYGRKVTA